MQIYNFVLKSNIMFEVNSIEKILTLCENAIMNFNVSEDIQFKLKSIIHELVVNSLEHGYKKKSGIVNIEIKKSDTFVFFEISDEGDGIDLSQIDLNREIFDLNSFTTRGWGLSIINNFSKDMKIQSNEPKGTKISLTLPI